MSLSLSGTLYTPKVGEPVPNATLAFQAVTTAGQVLKYSRTETTTDGQGAYAVELNNGRYNIQVTQVDGQRWDLAKGVPIDDDTQVSELNELIREAEGLNDLTSPLIIEFRTIRDETRDDKEQATIARNEAVEAKDIAEGSATTATDKAQSASQSEQNTRQAAAATGPYTPYATKAAAQSAIGAHGDGDLIQVDEDESRDGVSTRYRVSGGALVDVFEWLAAKLMRYADGLTVEQGRGAVHVADLATLLSRAELRIPGLRAQISEYEPNSGVGGGLLYWDAQSEEDDNAGTVFAVPGVTTGRWKRSFEGAAKTSFFGGHDLASIERALAYAYATGGDLAIDDGGVTHRPTSSFYIGPESGAYEGTITGNLTVWSDPSQSDNGALVEFRNFQGHFNGDIYANAFRRLSYAVSFKNCRSAKFGYVHGRQGLVWGILVDSADGANNNSMSATSLRATLSGSRAVASFSFVENTGPSTTISQRAVLSCTVPPETLVVRFDGAYYLVDSVNEDSITVFPSVPAESQSADALTYWAGGGAKWFGPDSGVANIGNLVCQANYGIGHWMASLYGQTTQVAVYELNDGPDVLVGSSFTSSSLKNTIVDGYFEKAGSVPMLMVKSANAQISIQNDFNLVRRWIYYENYLATNSVSEWNANSNVRIGGPGYGNHISRRGISGTSTTVSQGDYVSVQTGAGNTTDHIITVEASTDPQNNKLTTVDLLGFINRDVVIVAENGGLVDGASERRITTPNKARLVIHRDRVQNNDWHTMLIPAT